jgi:hypothetical protein
MNVHDAKYEYTFNNNPRNPIKLDELTQLLPFFIDAWATLKTEEINLQIIPITSRLHTQISTFPENENGLKRHFEDQRKKQKREVGSFERGTPISMSKPSNQKIFDPKKDIKTHEIAQLLPLLIDAWKGTNTYEHINHKKIPINSALHQKIGNSKEGLWRHFEAVSTSNNPEISLRNYSNCKYFFDPELNPELDPEKDKITDYDIAQILPILIEAWANTIYPCLDKKNQIFPDLNDKIDNLPEKTKKNCFKEFPEANSQSVIQDEAS